MHGGVGVRSGGIGWGEEIGRARNWAYMLGCTEQLALSVFAMLPC